MALHLGIMLHERPIWSFRNCQYSTLVQSTLLISDYQLCRSVGTQALVSALSFMQATSAGSTLCLIFSAPIAGLKKISFALLMTVTWTLPLSTLESRHYLSGHGCTSCTNLASLDVYSLHETADFLFAGYTKSKTANSNKARPERKSW